jgi:hypothetical protein
VTRALVADPRFSRDRLGRGGAIPGGDLFHGDAQPLARDIHLRQDALDLFQVPVRGADDQPKIHAIQHVVRTQQGADQGHDFVRGTVLELDNTGFVGARRGQGEQGREGKQQDMNGRMAARHVSRSRSAGLR